MSVPAEDPGTERDRLSRRRRQLAVIAAVAIAAAASGLVAGTLVRSPAQVAAETEAPPRTPLTAEVEQRAVVQTVVARGEAQLTGTVELAAGSPPDGMRAVVTGVSVKVGDRIDTGRVLLEVAERPMFVVRGRVPMYRDIEPGATGKDVEQLQRSLREVGWSVWDRAGLYGPSTQAAVVNQYRRMGYSPLRAAVENVDEADEGRADGAEDGDTPARTSAAKKAPPVVGGPIVPMAECFFVATLPSVVSSLAAHVGGAAEGPAVTLAATSLTVRADLNPADGASIRAGQAVRIQDEAGRLDVKGRVTAVGAARVDDNGGLTVPVVVKPRKRIAARWAGQPVRVSFPTTLAPPQSLVVPLSAIRSTADGQIRLTTVAGGRRTTVEVAVGAKGDGFVEVRPTGRDGLKAGDHVLLGR